MHQAFILGAGLGTRLRPLTDRLPKPLVPLFHQSIAAWTINACAKLGIRRFAINTHHLPEAWDDFATHSEGNDITFFHEPILLETGGGLRNISEWVGDSPLLVHNGDIFSTMPLDALVAAHKASGLPVTLALRSQGIATHIALDATGSRVIDIHEKLGRTAGTHVFSGIYCVNPEFIRQIAPQAAIVASNLNTELFSNTISGVINSILANSVQNFFYKLFGSSVDVNFNYSRVLTDMSGTGNASNSGAGSPNYRENVSLQFIKSLLDDKLIITFGSDFNFSTNTRMVGGSQSFLFLPDVNVEYKITPDGKFRTSFFFRSNFDALSSSGRRDRTGGNVSFRTEFDRLFH
jgi:dTDP-glucose pyrophosphorylase